MIPDDSLAHCIIWRKTAEQMEMCRWSAVQGLVCSLVGFGIYFVLFFTAELWGDLDIWLSPGCWPWQEGFNFSALNKVTVRVCMLQPDDLLLNRAIEELEMGCDLYSGPLLACWDEFKPSPVSAAFAAAGIPLLLPPFSSPGPHRISQPRYNIFIPAELLRNPVPAVLERGKTKKENIFWFTKLREGEGGNVGCGGTRENKNNWAIRGILLSNSGDPEQPYRSALGDKAALSWQLALGTGAAA